MLCLRESTKLQPPACTLSSTYTYLQHSQIHTSTHVRALLSGLVSPLKLQTESFIMVKRTSVGHSDSFTCAAVESSPILPVFLAIGIFSIFQTEFV